MPESSFQELNNDIRRELAHQNSSFKKFLELNVSNFNQGIQISFSNEITFHKVFFHFYQEAKGRFQS